MAEVEIRAGAKVDLATRTEMRADLEDVTRSFEMERELVRARGVKWMRVAVSDPAAPTKETIPGPETGYIWKLRRISAVLSAADSVSAYIGDGTGPRLIAFTPSVSGQTAYVLTFGPEEILIGGESLYLTTSGTGHFSTYYVSAWQVPEEMQWKLL